VPGHNRWHPDVEPAVTISPGETVVLQAPLGSGDQIGPESTHADLLTLDFSHNLLAGPVYVSGAKPGDLLAVEIVDVAPEAFGFSGVFPGFGFLTDLIPGPYLVRWTIDGGFARSDSLPGITIPAAPFPGTIGVAPSRTTMAEIHSREDELARLHDLDLSDFMPPPVPAHAFDGLGTMPPREIGGNLDVRGLRRGSRLFLPVKVEGALLSLGDVHFAQGEGEVCGSAIEIGAEVTVRIERVSSPRWRSRFPVYETATEPARRYIATTGIPITDLGDNELLDPTLAARRALLELIDYLTVTYGFDREAAYVLTSVAAELRMSAVVDIPNTLVSALLPIDIFDAYAGVA
jgi:formamidase